MRRATVGVVNDTAIGRLRRAIAMVVAVLIVGTVGYLLFGLSFTDAVYQTVTTVSTVGFRELHEFSTLEQWFTHRSHRPRGVHGPLHLHARRPSRGRRRTARLPRETIHEP